MEAHLQDRLDAVRQAIPEELLEALVDREVAIRAERNRIKRSEAREAKRAARKKRPDVSRYAMQRSGRYKPVQKPPSSPEDRKYVAGVLRHWRQVHRLSTREAQARVGYSPRSSSWRHWEDSFAAPSYNTLLRIIAATGLGYWIDHQNLMELDPELRLEALTTRLRAEKAAKKESKAT